MNNLDIILEKTKADFPEINGEWIESIIHNGQWRAVKDALYLHKSVEITGLGRFAVRPYKLVSRLKTLNKFIEIYQDRMSHLTEDQTKEYRKYEKSINTALAEIEYTKTKL